MCNLIPTCPIIFPLVLQKAVSESTTVQSVTINLPVWHGLNFCLSVAEMKKLLHDFKEVSPHPPSCLHHCVNLYKILGIHVTDFWTNPVYL